jgi:hypothetical protein
MWYNQKKAVGDVFEAYARKIKTSLYYKRHYTIRSLWEIFEDLHLKGSFTSYSFRRAILEASEVEGAILTIDTFAFPAIQCYTEDLKIIWTLPHLKNEVIFDYCTGLLNVHPDDIETFETMYLEDFNTIGDMPF